jgi:hypothetical protein
MITFRTTRYPVLPIVSAALLLAVLGIAALVALSAPVPLVPGEAEAQPVAHPFPAYRLNELKEYRASEWGLAPSGERSAAPWFDPSRLPEDYVRSEKGLPATRLSPRPLYVDLMAVK